MLKNAFIIKRCPVFARVVDQICQAVAIASNVDLGLTQCGGIADRYQMTTTMLAYQISGV